MHVHVLKMKGCKATQDMSTIIMGTPSDVDGGMNSTPTMHDYYS